MLDERLLRILVCPACHGDVDHRERRQVIVCRGCARRYPVRDRIPVMLIEEATFPPGVSSPADAAADSA